MCVNQSMTFADKDTKQPLTQHWQIYELPFIPSFCLCPHNNSVCPSDTLSVPDYSAISVSLLLIPVIFYLSLLLLFFFFYFLSWATFLALIKSTGLAAKKVTEGFCVCVCETEKEGDTQWLSGHCMEAMRELNVTFDPSGHLCSGHFSIPKRERDVHTHMCAHSQTYSISLSFYK